MLAETAAKRIAESLHFVICNECFWCASFFGATHRVGACPTCRKDAIEFLRLSRNECYTFGYSPSSGVVLDFSQGAYFGDMSSPTCYNKASCRACGNRLVATKTCRRCSEPVNWKCSICRNADDSIHAHPEWQGRFLEGIAH
jgi:hypothetical protein